MPDVNDAIGVPVGQEGHRLGELQMTRPSWRTVKSAGLEPHHREWLRDTAAEVASRFPAPVMVNVGIYYGASMHCLRAGAPDCHLIGVDIKDWGVIDPNGLGAMYMWDDSTTCHGLFNARIHLLFLDGVQAYEGAREDVLGWCPKVAVGGLAIFNCYHLLSPRWGIGQAADEWLEATSTKWEDVEAPHPIRAVRRTE